MWGPSSFKVFNIINQTVEFKVHRLQIYIMKSFLEDYFGHYGCVVSVRMERLFYSMSQAENIRDVCKVDSDTFNVTVTPQAKARDAYVVAGAYIPFRYFNIKSYDNSFKIYGPRLNFKEVYEHLKKVVRSDDIRDECKLDSDTFNVIVTTKEAFDLMSNLGSIVVQSV